MVNDGKKITIIGAGEETTKISTSQVCAFQLQGAGAALDLQDVTVSVSAANARVIRLVDNDNMSFSAANVTFETTTPGGNIGIYARGVWEDTSKDIRDGLSITLNNWNYVDSSTTVEQYYSFSVGLYMQEFSSLSLTMQECNVVVDCYAVYFQEKTAAEVKISNSKLQGWAAYYASVSYTHLDVYKRQGRWRALRCCLPPRPS